MKEHETFRREQIRSTQRPGIGLYELSDSDLDVVSGGRFSSGDLAGISIGMMGLSAALVVAGMVVAAPVAAATGVVAASLSVYESVMETNETADNN